MHTPKLQILGSLGAKVDETFTKEGFAADAKATGDRLKDIESDIVDLLYKAISIDKFTNNIGTVEIGSTITAVTFSWAFNKAPASVTLDGVAQATEASGSVEQTGLSITGNKTFTLKATDERNAVASKTTSISFLNGVYYGVSTETETLDSAFVLSLTKNLRSNKLTSFSVNAGEGQYIYYCLPVRFGTCTFAVGGFTGGFTLADTIEFTNASGYTEKYYIYKSDNANLGSTNIAVA